jgi:hypothetical protein
MGIGIICLLLSILINFPRLTGNDDGSLVENTEIPKKRGRGVSETSDSSRKLKSDRGSSYLESLISAEGDSAIDSKRDVVRERNIRISKTGGLPSGVARELGLTEEEYRAVQTNLSEFWASMTEEYSKRVIFDEALSRSAGENVDCYRIAALSESDRRTRLEVLKKELSASSSVEVGGEIIRGLEDCSSFGYLGKYDISFRFEPMTITRTDHKTGLQIGEAEVIPGDNVVKYVYSSPITGSRAVSGSSNLKRVNELFCGIFNPGREADMGR